MDRKKKPSKKTAKNHGPYLAAAVFCEHVLEEKPTPDMKTGVISITRIVNQIILSIPHNAPVDFAPPVGVSGLITFANYKGKSKHKLELIMNYPDGKVKALPLTNFSFGDSGSIQMSNTLMKIVIQTPITGMYWIDVNLDGKSVTRMPLLVEVNRLPKPVETKKQ